MNKQAAEKPLKAVPSMLSVSRLYNEGQPDKPISWKPSIWLAMNTEAVKSPLLKAVTKQQLVKTKQTDREDLLCVIVICRVCRLVRLL
jgi:hypothetical protein